MAAGVTRPERIAAAARALGAELSLRMRLYADALADALAREHRLVAWDAEQLIGQIQSRLEQLRRRRFSDLGGPSVRVVERAAQPLESLELTWEQLRRGRRVALEFEPGACSASIELLRGMSHALEQVLGERVLKVADVPWEHPPDGPEVSRSALLRAVPPLDDTSTWPVVGVFPPGPRIAVIEPEADRELAAYVLARVALRRSGTDPRAVKLAFVQGLFDRLQRHLHRLWVGVQVGPAGADGSFAGPVDAQTRDGYLDACQRWSETEGVESWCPGGELERAGAHGSFLAPSLFATRWPVPELPMVGPMLVVVRCSGSQARAAAEAVARVDGQIILIGGRVDDYPGDVTAIRGALLVERLPPGLPEPRPV